jgi:hypothetical protein
MPASRGRRRSSGERRSSAQHDPAQSELFPVFDLDGQGVPSEEERELILSERDYIAVDAVYASKAREIHSPAESAEVDHNTLVLKKRTIALSLPLGETDDEAVIRNIIDLVRPLLGPYGARCIQLLYQIANDPPYWRRPVITVDTNDLLDLLGEKRDKRGIHYARNRERLRNTLNAAHNLEIVAEMPFKRNGKTERVAIRRSLISFMGATFDREETSDIPTEQLFQRGLPKTVQLRLNFYDTVRLPNGRMGRHYILEPRADFRALPRANYTTTEEALRAYLQQEWRRQRPSDHCLLLTRQEGVEAAGIRTTNKTWATRTLQRALDRLIQRGIVDHYTVIPLQPHETFEVYMVPHPGIMDE